MNNIPDNGDLFRAQPIDPGEGEEFLIVGLGASAGGIRALKEFFAQVGTLVDRRRDENE
jgi:chemotaxis response regulator CheB